MTTALTLQKYRGALALVGPYIDNLASVAFDCSDIQKETFSPLEAIYHITLLIKDELRSLAPEKIAALKLDTRHIFSIGVGGKAHAGVYWVAIIWAAGQQIRKQLGLPPKHFHVTLSANDIHDVDKGVTSLIPGQFPQAPSDELLNHIAFTFQSFGQYHSAIEYASRLVLQSSQSYKGFLRLADASFAEKQFKVAMLSYACAFERSEDEKVKAYCLKKLAECSKEAEWGQVFQEYEVIQLGALKDVSSFLLKPWSQDLRETLSDQKFTPALLLEPRQSLFVPSPRISLPNSGFYKLPRFFRWLIPYHFAITSTPRNEDDIAALASSHLGIRHVLTLTEGTPLPESWFQGKRITNTYLPIPNFHPPSIEQMDLIMRLFDDQDKIPLLVHCGGGKGRAGTVAACYLAAYGFNKPNYEQDHPELAATEAISSLRALRPGSLETAQQEAFVSTWCRTIWKRQSVYPDLPSEPPPCPLEIEGTLPTDGNGGDGDLFVLVGLPGSGKSWFAKSLLARDPKGWIHISQDESGSRASCEMEIGRAPRGGRRVLLDRCNTSAEDRKRWILLTANWATAPVCVFFNYTAEICIARAQMREAHPTLRPGNRVRHAVRQMKEVFVRPRVDEEGFRAVVVVRSFAAAQEAVLRLSRPLTIYKFPRTPHLLDLGAATEDDVHADVGTFRVVGSVSDGNGVGGRVVMTEKIDGANMGFSLSADRTRILVQNRSHYVNSSTHEQFKKLGAWVERHDTDLRRIVDRDPFFAERYILYGEWMYATHSIPYTRLPDLFIAYDLFDRSTETWADTATLRGLLEGTGICSVPLIWEGESLTMPTNSELLAMIQFPSAFYDGRVEGVYVKVEKQGCVKMRGKIVRSDFIAGNEHWTRGNLQLNKLQIDFSGVIQS